MIATLFGFANLPQWVKELLVLALVGVGVYLWATWHDDELIREGVAKETATIKAQNAADALILQQRAATAEAQRDEEERQLTNFVASHPVNASQLCKPAPANVQTRTTTTGTAGSPTTAPVLQSVPKPDPLSPDNRLRLLVGLAGLADGTSEQVREFQRR